MAGSYDWVFTVLPLIFGAIGAVAAIFAIKSRKTGPKVIATCYKSGWYRRTGTSIVTNVVIFLKFENKTDSVTTVKDCSLQIEYNGATYGPFQSESLNLEMTSRRATDKRVDFTVPVEMVDITSDIPKAIVTSYYIPKKTKTEVYDIPNAVV